MCEKKKEVRADICSGSGTFSKTAMHHIVRSGLVFTSEAAAKAPIHSDSGVALMPPFLWLQDEIPLSCSCFLFLVFGLIVNIPDIKSSIQYLENVDSNSLRTSFRCEIVAV